MRGKLIGYLKFLLEEKKKMHKLSLKTVDLSIFNFAFLQVVSGYVLQENEG